jgi:hypothetical protein
MLQNFVVVQEGPRYRALAELTHDALRDGPDASAVIQAAVDALGDDGGTVTLGRGAFQLAEPVRLPSRVWLRGSGRATRLVVGATNAEGVGILAYGAHGAVISDLSLQPADAGGGVAGLVLEGCGDSAVRGVFCAGFGRYGVWVRGSSFLCQIESCSLAGNAAANLLLDELRAGPYGSYIPNRVSACTTYGGGAGIECRRAIGVSISACVVHQSRGPAYHVHTRSNGAAIVGSRSYQATGDAVLVERSDELMLSGNTFCWHAGHGVAVRDSSWGTINGNQIVDSGSTGEGAAPPDPRDGINLRGASGYQVSGNTIFNWGVAPPLACGVREDEHSFKNSVVGNSVNYYAEAAVRCAGRETLARDNLGHPERPLNLPPGAELPSALQSYERALTEQFITIKGGPGEGTALP